MNNETVNQQNMTITYERRPNPIYITERERELLERMAKANHRKPGMHMGYLIYRAYEDFMASGEGGRVPVAGSKPSAPDDCLCMAKAVPDDR